jgi:hypothetical protein
MIFGDDIVGERDLLQTHFLLAVHFSYSTLYIFLYIPIPVLGPHGSPYRSIPLTSQSVVLPTRDLVI